MSVAVVPDMISSIQNVAVIIIVEGNAGTAAIGALALIVSSFIDDAFATAIRTGLCLHSIRPRYPTAPEFPYSLASDLGRGSPLANGGLGGHIGRPDTKRGAIFSRLVVAYAAARPCSRTQTT